MSWWVLITLNVLDHKPAPVWNVDIWGVGMFYQDGFVVG